MLTTSFFSQPLPDAVTMFCTFAAKVCCMARGSLLYGKGYKGRGEVTRGAKWAPSRSLSDMTTTIAEKGTEITELLPAVSPYPPTHTAGHTPTTMYAAPHPPLKAQRLSSACPHYVAHKIWGFLTIPNNLRATS